MRFLNQCMLDLTQQTLFQQGELEILMVDTGSTEYEWESIQQYLDQYPDKIQYIRTYDRKPLYQAWNIAIKLARGQYLTNANTDDRHAPHALETLANYLDQNSDIDAVYADCHVSAIENETWNEYQKSSSTSKTMEFRDYFRQDGLLYCQFGPQPMWRAQVNEQIGYFSHDLKAAGDWDFNIRFSLAGLRAAHLPETLGLYLQHDEAISFRDDTMKRENAIIKETYRDFENVYQMYSHLGFNTDDQLGRVQALIDMAFRAICFFPPWRYGRPQHEWQFAFKLLNESLQLDPQNDWSWMGMFLIESANSTPGNFQPILEKMSPGFQEKFQSIFSKQNPQEAFFYWMNEERILPNFQQKPEDNNQNTSSKSTNITHLNTHDYKGGAAKIAWLLNHHQVQSGLKSKMLVGSKLTDYENAILFEQSIDTTLQAQTRSEGRLYHEYRDSLHIGQHPLLRNSDVIHLHNLHGDWLHPLALRSITQSQKPIVWTLHDLQSITGRCAHPFECQLWKTGCGKCPSLATYPKVQKDVSDILWSEKRDLYELLRQTGATIQLVAPSKWVAGKLKDSLLKGFPVKVIPNGVDAQIYQPIDQTFSRQQLQLPLDKFILLFTADGGLNNSFKGGETAVDLMRQLREESPELLLVVVGQRTPPRIALDQQDLNHLHFVPFENNESRMALYYNSADLFINPTKADTFSLSTCEAMACACPSISFGVDAIPELVTHRTEGYLVTPGRSDQFIQLTRELIHQGELRNQIAQNAHQKFLNNFTLDKMNQAYDSLYEKLLSPSFSKNSYSDWFQLKTLIDQNPQTSSHLNDAGLFWVEKDKPLLAWYYFLEATRQSTSQPEYLQNLEHIQSMVNWDQLPQISLAIPNYNQGSYIGKAIQSVISQGYPKTELHIIDGGSTDQSVEVIRSFEKDLTSWVSEPDNGQSDAINKGIQASQGDIFNWLCGDDWLEPGAYFAIAQAYVDAPESVAWVGSANRILEQSNALYYVSHPNGLDHEQIKTNFTARSFYQPACFMKMKSLKQIQGVREDLHYTMDYDLFVRLSKLGNFTQVDHLLCSTLSQPDAKTVMYMEKLWSEKIQLLESYGSLEAVPNLQGRIADKNNWNFVLPRVFQNQWARLSKPLQDLPFLSHCRNTANAEGTYIQIWTDFTRDPKEALEVIKVLVEVILSRVSKMRFRISGPGSEQFIHFFQGESVQIIPAPQPESEGQFCQLHIAYSISENQFKSYFHGMNETFKFKPLVLTPDLAKSFDIEDGVDGFEANSIQALAFKALQLCYEPTVWGHFVMNRIFKSTRASHIY